MAGIVVALSLSDSEIVRDAPKAMSLRNRGLRRGANGVKSLIPEIDARTAI
jgi:hypothetical protein